MFENFGFLERNFFLKIIEILDFGKYTFRKYTFRKYILLRKYIFGNNTFRKYTFGEYTFGVNPSPHTTGLTWVGARDTCVSNKKGKRTKNLQIIQLVQIILRPSCDYQNQRASLDDFSCDHKIIQTSWLIQIITRPFCDQLASLDNFEAIL